MRTEIYPTLLAINNIERPNQPVLDGQSLAPLFDGKMTARDKPLGFLLWNGSGNFDKVDFETEIQGVWIDGKYKLIVPPSKELPKPNPKRARRKMASGRINGQEVQLFDIFADPAHKTICSTNIPRSSRASHAVAWQKSVRSSFDGNDFSKK